MIATHADDVSDDFSLRSVVAHDELELGGDWGRIPYGTAIDLGGCGKGFIADKLAAIVEDIPWVSGYWFSLGGDIICKGLDESGVPWRVGIESADTENTNVVANAITTGERTAVATSAITARIGHKDNVAWHHIINPKTLQPATTDLIGASIMSQSALSADVLATCAIIEGGRKAQNYLKRYKIQGILLQLINRQLYESGAIVSVLNNQNEIC